MTILYSSHFERTLKKMNKESITIMAEREKIFRSNCFDIRLKTHKLKGKFRSYWSFSITYSHRILFEFLQSNTVAFIDIGDHTVYEQRHVQRYSCYNFTVS